MNSNEDKRVVMLRRTIEAGGLVRNVDFADSDEREYIAELLGGAPADLLPQTRKALDSAVCADGDFLREENGFTDALYINPLRKTDEGYEISAELNLVRFTALATLRTDVYSREDDGTYEIIKEGRSRFGIVPPGGCPEMFVCPQRSCPDTERVCL